MYEGKRAVKFFLHKLKLLVCLCVSCIRSVSLCVGITQDRIDDCRRAKETAMLADIRALVQSGADLNARDDNGATLVRRRDTYCTDR